MGISNQTTLPFLVGRDPQRLAIWSTRYSPRPPSSVSSALRIRGRRRSVSKTSTHTAAAPRRSRSVNCLGGGGGATRSASFSHTGGGTPARGTAPAGSSAIRRGRLTGKVVCRTTLVTTSETSRQASSACLAGTPQRIRTARAWRRASETLIGSAGKAHSQEARSRREVRTTTMAMSSSISPGTASIAAGAMPPVGEAIGVEDEGGSRRELAYLLPVGGQARYAPAHAEQDPLVLDLQLAHLAAGDEQRRLVPGVGERQRPGPRVVDQVGAARHRRIGLARRIRRGRPQRPAPVVQLAHDLGGRLVVLGEGPQRGAELAHDRGRPGTAPLHVADDDPDPSRRQRDQVIPVAAHLGLDPLAVGLQRFGGHVPPGDFEAVEGGQALRQQAGLERQRGAAFLLE